MEIWLWAGAMITVLLGLGIIGTWLLGLYLKDEQDYIEQRGRHRK